MTAAGRLQPPRRLVAAPADNRLRRPLTDLLAQAPQSWLPVVARWRASDAGQRLLSDITNRQASGAAIYPAAVLRALELTPLDQTRVVILGQDPYHGAGQAEGLAFSVPSGVKPPPSLRNILRELERDLGVRRDDGHLGSWARQGVLLLNTVLTVEDGCPGAHARKGWEVLTDMIVSAVAEGESVKVFMLWGAQAQAKAELITSAGAGRHLLLQANHPSPLSARRQPTPFVGCGHFGRAAEFLASQHAATAPVDWAQ